MNRGPLALMPVNTEPDDSEEDEMAQLRIYFDGPKPSGEQLMELMQEVLRECGTETYDMLLDYINATDDEIEALEAELHNLEVERDLLESGR